MSHTASASKSEEASLNTAAPHEAGPPTYTPGATLPPSYDTLKSDMSSLAVGDPSETISVPMISRVHEKSIHDLNPFSRKTGKISTTVTVRKMTREFYLKHYVKDADGKFVGSANQAPDAGLVFVPSHSTPEDVMRQVSEVAFVRQGIRGQGIGRYGMPDTSLLGMGGIGMGSVGM